MEVVDDVTADTVVVLRHDAHTFAVVERSCEIVDHKTVDPSADKADDNHTERIDEESGAADDGTGDADGSTDIEVEILVHNLGQNVQSAGRSVDAEHQGLRGTQQQDKAAKIKPRVTHHRGGTRHQVIIGNLLPRQDGIPHVSQRAKNHGRVDGLGTKLMSNQNPCQNKQDSVDGHNDDRQADVDASSLEDVIQHNRKAGDGTDNQFARHQEIVYSGSGYKHAESHDDKLFPELVRFHYAKRIKNLTHSFV